MASVPPPLVDGPQTLRVVGLVGEGPFVGVFLIPAVPDPLSLKLGVLFLACVAPVPPPFGHLVAGHLGDDTEPDSQGQAGDQERLGLLDGTQETVHRSSFLLGQGLTEARPPQQVQSVLLTEDHAPVPDAGRTEAIWPLYH